MLFPCNGYGFLCEKEIAIIYDGLGRRLGTPDSLKTYIKDMGCVSKCDPQDIYETVCQISYKEMQEAKKINLLLEKHK